jgi:hypothetical protein
LRYQILAIQRQIPLRNSKQKGSEGMRNLQMHSSYIELPLHGDAHVRYSYYLCIHARRQCASRRGRYVQLPRNIGSPSITKSKLPVYALPELGQAPSVKLMMMKSGKYNTDDEERLKSNQKNEGV